MARKYVGRADSHLALGHADLALRDVDSYIEKMAEKGLGADWHTYHLRSKINTSLGDLTAAESDHLLAKRMYMDSRNMPDLPEIPLVSPTR